MTSVVVELTSMILKYVNVETVGMLKAFKADS